MIPAIPSLSASAGGGGPSAGELKNYFNSQNSGYRAPMVNIATGRSNLEPDTTATAGINPWLIGLALGAFVLLKLIKK